MKTFADYIIETESYLSEPTEGDVIDLEIAPGEIIESYVISKTSDSLTITSDEIMEQILKTKDIILEDIKRYGAVGSNRAIGYTLEEELEEGVMSEIDQDLHDIARGEDTDMLYDAFSGGMGPKTQAYLEDMFMRVAQHNRLHPDDQQEEILEKMMDELVDDYGDGDIDTPAEPAEPVAEDFMSRMLELAGCQRMKETAPDQPETNAAHTDPLAAKAAALAPVGTETNPTTATTVDEDGTDPVNAAGEDAEELEGNMTTEAEYQGRKVSLGKPMRGDVKKFKVYVKDPKTGNVKKINFGHGGKSAKRAGEKTLSIKKSDPARRRSFRARHRCDTAKDRTTARYWSCRMW